MSEQILEQLFDSPVKVRLLRLFLRNPEKKFTFKEIVRRTKSYTGNCRSQVEKLRNIKFLSSCKRKGVRLYFVNQKFCFYPELRTLVLKSSPASKERILNYFKKIPRLKLLILSGVFANQENGRVDLLIVGNGLNEKEIIRFLKKLEAEVGKELDYVILSTEEFKYRYDMFDRFLRDILEKPHDKLINRLKI